MPNVLVVGWSGGQQMFIIVFGFAECSVLF